MHTRFKKASRLLILSASLFLFLSLSALAAEVGTVTATSLRLRSEASTSGATIVCLKEGAKVTVLEKLDGWYKVTSGDKTGFVSADYLTVATVADGEVDASASSVQEGATDSVSAGVITGTTVNLRSGPGTDQSVLGTLAQNSKVTVLEKLNGWYKVSGNGTIGYVSADYLSLSDEAVKGFVTGSTVNVRSGPGTDYDRVATVNAGKAVTILGSADGWYKVSFDSTTGYIKSDYVSDSAVSSVGAQIAALAQNYLGTRYSYGGSSPNGFDCSGFTMYLYRQFGYSLPHGATAQYNQSGTSVSRDNLQPGDLVFFCSGSSSSISHVALYIGGGKIIHARYSLGRVAINSLSEGYYSRNYVGAKRVV